MEKSLMTFLLLFNDIKFGMSYLFCCNGYRHAIFFLNYESQVEYLKQAFTKKKYESEVEYLKKAFTKEEEKELNYFFIAVFFIFLSLKLPKFNKNPVVKSKIGHGTRSM